MTILTAGACTVILNSAGHVIPAAAGTAAGVLITGAKIWIQSEPVKAAISTAVGTGTSSGAVAGAIVGKTATSALTGALLGGMSAGGVGSVLAGSIAAVSGTITSGPLGLLTVGTSQTGNQRTYDCWKPVIRDISEEPSQGMILKDLVLHPNIASVTVEHSLCMPRIVLENKWSEKFEIQYVLLQDSETLQCHASRIGI